MNLITCKNISFVYDGVPAVKDLDFSVEPNDYLCIVGENGAGKSTLVKGLGVLGRYPIIPPIRLSVL